MLKVTFKNTTSQEVTMKLRKMDLNLYEPETKLPVSLTMEAGASKLIALTYPAGALDMTPSVRALVAGRAGLAEGEPALNYQFDLAYGTGTQSDAENEMEAPNPGTMTMPSADPKYSIVLITNDRMPRVLDLRLLSISGTGVAGPKMPLDVRVPAGGSAILPSLKILTPGGNDSSDVTIKYGYRLEPNKNWQMASMPIG